MRCRNTLLRFSLVHSPQRNQAHSLSDQAVYALLLPYCVRIHSSPPSISGVPCDSISAVNALRIIWRLSDSSLPAPQLRLWLLDSPLVGSHQALQASLQQMGLSGP